jgi:hypothetical protein
MSVFFIVMTAEEETTKTVLPSKSIVGKSGGTYIPPAKLRALHAQITDRASEDYQRLTWEALKKSINGLINKVLTFNPDQCRQHQKHHPRAVQREPGAWTRTIMQINHESTSCFAAIHPRVCCNACNHQYQVSNDWRAASCASSVAV